MENVDEIKKKYSETVIENLNKENFYKIIEFLNKEKCNFIEDIISDYLDLFVLEYNEFINKYNKLNQEYDGQFLVNASEDMNLLEKFYEV